MLAPDEAVLSQVFSPSDKRKTCRVCSAEPQDTYIFRKGWRVTKIVDVATSVSEDLVGKGACVCLCNRCGQAFRKRAALCDERKAMVHMISEFARDENDAVYGVDDVQDVDRQYEIDTSTSQATELPFKRQKFISYHASDLRCRNIRGSFIRTEHSASLLAGTSPARRRAKTQAEKDALMTIAAASANSGPLEYAGYAVTKTNTEGCHFTFFWIRKAATTVPLLVSVGHDKRKSGHFTYSRAPTLPDDVPKLNCTSRRQVLAWMLTNFRVPNRQLSARLRKDIPSISGEEARSLAGLDQREARVAAKRDQQRPMVPKSSAKASPMLTERRATTRSITTADATRSISPSGESERSDTMDRELPSPLTLLNISDLDVPSPSDLLMVTSPDVMRTSETRAMDTRYSFAVPTLPDRLSEEPETGTIDVVGASMCCGACGLSDHKTKKCPLQRGSGISISISPNTSQDGSGGSGTRAGDREGAISTADGMFFKSSDLLDGFGCWSEVNSPEEAGKLRGWAGNEFVPIPSSVPTNLANAMAVLAAHPNSPAHVIASALDEITRSNLSLKELSDSGIVAIVAGLLSTSAPLGRVADASRTLCHKWLSQARAAVHGISGQ